jgi:hypothetical protein
VIEIVLGAALAAAVVVFVAVPFLRESAPEAPPEPPDRDLAAAEERDRVLAELKELEFDHRTGKVSDDDYRALVQPLRQRAAQMLNGAALSNETQESAGEQHFSEASPPNSRSDR